MQRGQTAAAGGTLRARTLQAVRRTYPLAVEMAILAAAVVAWQFTRIPFEVSADRAIAAARDLILLEQALHIEIEAEVVRWVHEHPDLLDAATSYYRYMDETVVFGALAALRLIDPRRFPTVRTAFVLAFVPGIVVVAGYPMAPPSWVPGMPYSVDPGTGFEGGLRNSTAAAVSLHVGLPVLVAAAAFWIRPRSVLAWLTALNAALSLAVVASTGHHFVLDAAVGVACVTIAAAAALLIHGSVPRGEPAAGPLRIALAGLLFASLAFTVNYVVLRLVT